MSMYESRTYSQILPDGKAYRFYFLQEVKSFITSPSHGMALKGSGLYEVSGIAYSGAGWIEKVMVSADGGKSWGQAALQEPVLSKAFTRFRMPWRWDADLRHYRAGHGTKRVTCSRPAPNSLPFAAS